MSLEDSLRYLSTWYGTHLAFWKSNDSVGPEARACVVTQLEVVGKVLQELLGKAAQ